MCCFVPLLSGQGFNSMYTRLPYHDVIKSSDTLCSELFKSEVNLIKTKAFRISC